MKLDCRSCFGIGNTTLGARYSCEMKWKGGNALPASVLRSLAFHCQNGKCIPGKEGQPSAIWGGRQACANLLQINSGWNARLDTEAACQEELPEEARKG